MRQLPVIALTGHLGAGKTTLLNRLLRAPGARLGVVVNDFGSINVDAGLVTGQVDEAEAISGGCVCCLPDAGGLDEALEKLAQPRLRLDAVIVEASGVADPSSLARLIRFSEVKGVRSGGVVDVVDAGAHFETVDTGVLPPERYAGATLVVINKIDRVSEPERDAVRARITERIKERNPRAHVVAAEHGRIDPALVFDAAAEEAAQPELPFAEADGEDHAPHVHADGVTVPAEAPADPGRLVDLLEDPPEGVYRLKGAVTVAAGRGTRRFAVNMVGRQLHVASHAQGGGRDGLVAIGMHLDTAEVRRRLKEALSPAEEGAEGDGLRRLTRLRRLSE
ncbi:GTP-binding protein [Nocardiopsis sp. RSe5-2]|uniref:GTP-binding protein n=1 Tax=Nocardiopsis endophytica TaxID=3018445 RepID=A0ABT4UBY0_9ACTN|nr:CobW family GTP-binding protein [Nocardiopsis endophytica]MDA2814440.1 GTP-binding protein [Nocardiopsis endophytica]